jgi:hypothetical protein
MILFFDIINRTYAVQLKNQQRQTINCIKRNLNLQSLPQLVLFLKCVSPN